MKPISITIENVRSFRTKRTIPFADMRLFAIIGDTGAGKTSILEAMTYALYNRSTWSGRNVKELIAEGASFMAVSFEFAVGGDVYTVARRTSAGATQPEHRLRCDAINLDVSGESAVKEAITRALGMNDETFLRTVLLPQGQHSALLLATGKEKNQILSDIFRLEEITDVDTLAVQLCQQANGVVQGLASARRRFPESATEAVAAAELECETAATALKDSKKTQAAAIEVAERTQVLKAEMNAASARMETVLRLKLAISEMDELSAIAANLEEERAAAAIALKTAQTEHARAEKAVAALRKSGADAVSLRIVESRIGTLVREQQETEAQRARLDGLVREKNDLVQRVAPLAAAIDRMQNELNAMVVAARDASNRTLKDQEALRQFESTLAARNDTAERSSAADKATEKCFAEKSATETRAREVEREVALAVATRDAAEKTVQDASTATLAMQIGEHLHAGEKCPVCRQKVPANYEAPTIAVSLQSAREALAAAGKALAATSSQHAELLGASKQLKQEFATAERVAKPLRDRLVVADAELAKLLEQGEKPAAALRRLKASSAKSAAAEPALRAAREKAEGTLSLQRAEHTKLVTLVARLSSDVSEATTSLTTRAARCEQLASDIPKAFAHAVEPGSRPAALVTLSSGIEKATAVEAALALAANAATECAAKLADAERAFSEAVLGRRGAIFEQMRAGAETLGFSPQPIAEKQRLRWIEDTLRGAVVNESESCNSTMGALAARSKGLDEERAAMLGDPPIDPQQLVTKCTHEHAQAVARLENVRLDAARAAELDSKVALIEPAHLGLDTLHRALGAREFLAYARERRQRRLLQQATLILREMTDERYEFSGTFDIIDRQTNGTRSAQALSGGEKFLASLALSLAVVEIAASAGAKIESLFIDEGFATLDSESLEMAMLALRDRARHGRPIGVISHLREVGQYVDGTFRIEPGHDGSTFLYTDGPIEDETSVSLGLVSHAIGA